MVDVEVDIVDGEEAAEITLEASGGKHYPRFRIRARGHDGHGGRCRHLVTSGQPLSCAFMKAWSPGMVAR